MTLDKDDLNAIGEMIDEKLLEFHEKVTAPMVESKLLEFHEKVTAPMVESKLLEFHEKVTAPMVESKLLEFHEKVTAPMTDNVIDSLKEEIANTDNKIDRIERKLDAITDMLAVRVTDHEKRITKLEMMAA